MSLLDDLQLFYRKLNFDDVFVQGEETFADLAVNSNKITAAELKILTAADYQSLINSFGRALSLSIEYPDDQPTLKIENGSINSLDGSLTKINEILDTTRVKFKLKIDKMLLLERFGFTQTTVTAYYFFRANVLRLLGLPLQEADKYLFADKLTPRLFVVSEKCPCFKGSLLNIIGEDQAQTFDQSRLSLPEKTVARLRQFQGDELTRPNWVNLKLDKLTPLHFDGEWSGNDNNVEAAKRATAAQLQKLTILYTANRCSYADALFQAIYAGTDRAVVLKFADSVESHNGDVFAKLVNWIEDDKTKLNVFQTVTVRELPDDTQERNYQVFVESLPEILNKAEWSHKLFVENTINKHFEELQKFSNTVAETAKKVSEAIDTVTKGVTETLLATIALLIATVLTALVKSEATSSIFQISFQAFGVYLVVTAAYRLGSIGHGYWALRKDADEYQKAYNLKLDADKIKEAVRPIERRKSIFRLWFGITIGLYVVLIAAVLYASVNLPSYLERNGLIKAQPLPAAIQSPVQPTVAPTNSGADSSPVEQSAPQP